MLKRETDILLKKCNYYRNISADVIKIVVLQRTGFFTIRSVSNVTVKTQDKCYFKWNSLTIIILLTSGYLTLPANDASQRKQK